MAKTRIYILQFLGIILLLGGYLLGNQPDSKSVMHFNSDPTHQTVISKSTKYTVNGHRVQTTTITTDHNTKHKSKVSRHISFDVVLPPQRCGYVFQPLNIVQYSCALPQNYYYLFYEEINPPPPKAC
ncbi:MAG: hypothetical protein JWQ38_2455 [Flavipsychrobacter sp.]|nr:hypothetical protein [Flavipsychrobacter sp.]